VSISPNKSRNGSVMLGEKVAVESKNWGHGLQQKLEWIRHVGSKNMISVILSLSGGVRYQNAKLWN
jgi:hypothetical protein